MKRVMYLMIVIIAILVIGFLVFIFCIREEKDSALEIKSSEICIGDIYELTDNLFQDGLEHDFTNEELKELVSVLDSDSLKVTRKRPKQEKIVYIANFYNEKGEEVLSLAIDKDGIIYEENGYCITDKKLNNFFEKITGGM